MQIKLVAIGTRMPKWVEQGFSEYAKRLPTICQLELLEVPALKRGKNADIPRILRDEAAALRHAITQSLGAQAKIIALDRKGRKIDTLTLARQQQQWIDDSQGVAIVIGGPEGLEPEFLASADAIWTLSALTFAHPLVRVMVAEQLYRAWSINANLPYHRGE